MEFKHGTCDLGCCSALDLACIQIEKGKTLQTFLPYADYAESARVIDNKRLGKQRVECLQILKALTLQDYGWKNHPATKMWRNHEQALARYSIAMCDEWIARGFKDTCRQKIIDIAVAHPSAQIF